MASSLRRSRTNGYGPVALPPPAPPIPVPPRSAFKPIKLHLDRERELNFDLNAMVTLEEEFGVDTTQPGAFRMGNLKELRRLLWIGLLYEDPAITEQEAGHLVHLGNIEAVGQAIRQGLSQALVESPPGEAGEASEGDDPNAP